jgi:ABC-type Mn2+/Zn2+ transport system permease subunit
MDILQYDFMRRAFVVGLLLSVSCPAWAWWWCSSGS